MTFALIESLVKVNEELDQTASMISESLQDHPAKQELLESAEEVLGQLAAKLKAGALKTEEIGDYAQLYAALSMLASDEVRAGYNLDLRMPVGQRRFLSILELTGTDPKATEQVKRVATTHGQAQLKRVTADLTNFGKMDAVKQQLYINTINKLRLGFERVRGQLKNSKTMAPPLQPQPYDPKVPQI